MPYSRIALRSSWLEDAYWDTDGILSKAKKDCCLAWYSSPSTPSFAKELYALARVSELQALDAPLTVKDIASQKAFGDAGDVVLLVGGEEEILERMKPMLSALAHFHPIHGRSRFLGQLAKVSQTIQLSAQLVALVESHAICRANEEQAFDAVSAAVDDGLLSPYAARLCRAVEDCGFQRHVFCRRSWLSELQAVLNTSEDTDVVLPQSEACLRPVELFLVVGGTDMNATALGLVYADKKESERTTTLDWSRAETLYQQGHDDDDDDRRRVRSHVRNSTISRASGGYAGGYGALSSN